MKKIPVIQLISTSSLIAVIFWLYAILKNNFQIAQLATDFQLSWIPLSVNLVFLVVWFAIFTLLYRFTNTRYWIGKVFIYIIGMFFSLLAFDLFFTPFHYYLDSLNLYNKSNLMRDVNNVMHSDLFFCMSLIFISHEFQLIFINKNTKNTFRFSWLFLMTLVVSYFVIRRYL